MNNRRMRRFLLLLWFACQMISASAAEADWNVRVTPFDQVYPVLELSQPQRVRTAGAGLAFGDGNGLIAVRVHARRDGERVHLRADLPELDAKAEVDAVLPQAGADYELRPLFSWDTAQLAALRVPRRLQLFVSLQRDDEPAAARVRSVVVRPLSEALYFVRDGHDSVDLSWIFAAYVDEHDRVVDEILAAALQSGIVDKLDGYAGGSGDHVLRQAWAVWQALAAHGIRYSAADPGIARGPGVFSQRVRLLEQTWSDRSANCVDGSVLIASVLQRIGLRSFLVLVPGHAFVGFYTDPAATQAAYLETTVLGASPPALGPTPAFATSVDRASASGLDLAGFSAALALGQRRFTHNAARFDQRHRPDYAVIDIAAARAFGIEPIEAR